MYTIAYTACYRLSHRRRRKSILVASDDLFGSLECAENSLYTILFFGIFQAAEGIVQFVVDEVRRFFPSALRWLGRKLLARGPMGAPELQG